MEDHERAHDLAEERAFGVLATDDAHWLTDHLSSCAECRAYAAEMGAIAGALARSVDSQPTPPELRARIVAAAASRPVLVTRRRWGTWALGSAAAAALVACAIDSVVLRGQLAETQQELAIEQRAAAAVLQGQRFVRLAPVSGNGPSALWVQPATGAPYLVAPDLPHPPSDRTYQLWYIVGSNAVPAGTFLPDGILVPPILPPDASLIAVTDEPRGGSAKPTSAPFLAGKV